VLVVLLDTFCGTLTNGRHCLVYLKETMKITVIRVDGALKVDPAPDYITHYLQYSHRSFALRGWQRVNKFEKRELYSAAPDSGVITFAGFFDKITSLINDAGDEIIIDDRRTLVKEPDLPAVKNINWDGIGSVGLRDYQAPLVAEFLFAVRDGNGICCATGGVGKTIFMACTYAAFSHIGQTILAVPLKAIFEQTYDKFCKLFPDKHIGRVGNGCCDISEDITITSFKSLPKCPLEKCKLLLMDEIQGTTSDGIVKILSSVTPVRMLGFTATDKNLFNQADKLVKGLFGERLIFVPYEDAQANGAVVPCKVYMVKVPDMAVFDAGSIEGKIMRGIKRNEVRNRLIGEVCGAVPKDWQTLVFVDHIADHLIPLYKFMPQGTTFVHRGQDKEFGAFSLNPKKQDQNLEDFRSGKYQYLLATDCLRSGADVPQIKVVVQASGGTSEVEILQEAYRAARLAPDKTHAIIIDFQDNHDETLNNMAAKREAIYKKQGWIIKQVDSVKDIVWEWTEEKPREL
jgi:superfamily II DNA or RNA helicase